MPRHQKISLIIQLSAPALTLIVWLLIVGSYREKIDNNCMAIPHLREEAHAADVDRTAIRGELATAHAQTSQMLADMLRTQTRMDAKLDRLIEK